MKVNLPVIQTIEKPVSGEWGIEPSGGQIIKVLRNTNFNNDGSLNLKDVVEREIVSAKISSKKLKYGDILIEKSGGSPNQPVGRVVFFDGTGEDYLFSNFTSALRPKKDIFPKYLFYLLYGNHLFKRTLSYQNKTTGILNLQLERYLKESIIPVPSFEDQQRIATILDHADSIRRKNRQILEKYNELAQSVFYEMFGDPIKNTFNYQIITLKEACYSIKDGPHLSPKYVERGIPFISVNNIIKGFWDFSNLKFISQRDHELFNKKCNPRKGDILYSKGGTTGFAKYIDIDLEFSNWVHLAVLKFDREKINGRFLESMLNSPYCYSQSQLLTRGIANRDLVLGQMAKIKLLSPPIELQKKFSDINENIENQKVYVKQCLQKSEDLFQSLLQRAFRGEL